MTLNEQLSGGGAGLKSAGSEGERKANVVTDVKLPRDLKAKVLIWEDLTIDDVSDLFQKWEDATAVKNTLIERFHLENQKQHVVVLDLYYYCLQFCKQSKFSVEQSSAVFSIVKNIHEAAIETPFNNLSHCYKYMKDLILCHSVKRPPFGIELFTPEEAKLVSEYIVNSYFRHFKLYKFVFTPKLQLDITFNYKGVYDSGPDPTPDDVQSKPETAGTIFSQATVEEEESEEEETPAMKELKAIIQEELDKHLTEMKTNLEENIKANDEVMNKKLQTLEESQPVAAGKGRPSSKGKKK